MKKRIRKMLLKKYAAVVLSGTLTILLLYFVDWMFGYGITNINTLFPFTITTQAEKILMITLAASFLIPDLIHWITGNQPGRELER
ncbi:hypothetical protein SAMN04487895_103152 [Paenibacillus sophorae]|uniref:Uncharacterized protein n=1 Tax=Paenibacillus sophorae TaxID=1333845 RepID=A0A1H8JUA6_9BACL|nr:hypothetical protein [Paenibacillus sophorae]QWU13485.1 hypothetical protein KP014_15925 [Paenibacillus sophorae]SEN84181.1 hypothetical protein SAMN04487895_103152 [Paenibacillus sophorae]